MMKESLRVFTVAPGTVRSVTHDVTVEGVKFPAGANILVRTLL